LSSLIKALPIINTLAIVEAFRDLPDTRRKAGLRHDQALCLALFTLAISAGCRGFISINDWLHSYQEDWIPSQTLPKWDITVIPLERYLI